MSYVLFVTLFEGKLFGFNIYITILGHFPEFSLGVFFALADNRGLKLPRFIIITALILFALGNYFKTFWYVSHFSALILLLPILESIKKI